MASKNGIEVRATKAGVKRYRGIVKVDGKLRRGPWGSNAEARSWRSKALGEIEAGTLVASTPKTLNEAWADFISQARAGTALSRSRKPFKPATLRGYARGWSKIAPEIGAHRLSDVRRADVQAMVDRWAKDGMLSADGTTRSPVQPSTIRNSLDPLRVIYRRALMRGLVVVNPTDGLDVPADTTATTEMRFASREEAARLIAAAPPAERALWAVAFYAGLRRGELRALRWTDLDLDGTRPESHYHATIYVTRSWDDEKGEQAPKTEGSVRRVPLVPALLDALKEHASDTGRGGDDLVFGRSATEPFIPSTVRSRALVAWEAANVAAQAALGRELEAAERCDPITLHQCRHTFASLMIAAGCNAKALSVVMGHASITITFDRYGHLMPGGAAETGRMLAAYLDAT